MRFGLEGKHAVVAAASRGLGRAVALGLAAEGARVAVCARNSEALGRVVEDAEAAGGEALAVEADLSKVDNIERMLERARERFGPIDILFVNTGGPPLGEFADFSDEDWERSFRSLVLGAVRLIRGVLPDMLARGSGRILLSTSIAVQEPQPWHLLSTSLRATVTGMAKNLAREVAGSGVTVNVLVPDRILTARTRANAGFAAEKAGISLEEELERRSQAIPMGRYGTPEEYASAAVFLASDAAGYITGVNLRIDGGRYAGLF